MASSFIQLPPQSTGLKIDTSELTVSSNTVERENMCIADPSTAANIAAVTAANALKVDGSAVTQPVNGTVTANAGTGTFNIQANASTNLNQVAGSALGATAVVNYGSTPAAVAVPAVNSFITNTVTVSGTVTANAGSGTFTTSDSHLPSSAALSDTLANPTTTEVGANLLAWDSTNTVWRRVQVDAGTGTLKVDASASTQPVSGTVTANQGTANATPWNENVAQFGGNAVVTGTGASGTGIPRVTVSNDSNVLATQSGTWTVATNADTIIDGTTAPSKGLLVLGQSDDATPIYAPMPLAVGGESLVVSGTVTANQGGAPWADNITQAAGVALTGQVAGSLPVTVVSSNSALADESAFMAGTSIETPIGGVYTGLANVPVLTNAQTGAVQVTADRRLIVRDPQNDQIIDLLGTLIQEVRAMRTALVYMVTENGDVRDVDFDPGQNSADFQPIN